MPKGSPGFFFHNSPALVKAFCFDHLLKEACKLQRRSEGAAGLSCLCCWLSNPPQSGTAHLGGISCLLQVEDFPQCPPLAPCILQLPSRASPPPAPPPAPGSSHMPEGDWGNFLLDAWSPALVLYSLAPADRARARAPQPHAEGRAEGGCHYLGWHAGTPSTPTYQFCAQAPLLTSWCLSFLPCRIGLMAVPWSEPGGLGALCLPTVSAAS